MFARNGFKHCETGEEISYLSFVREVKRRGIRRRRLRYARALSSARDSDRVAEIFRLRTNELLDAAGYSGAAAPWDEVVAWFKTRVMP